MEYFMKASEFIKENASGGATAAGNVATVVQPLRSDGKSFFGGDPKASIYYNEKAPVAIIRRPGPTAEANKKGKRKKASD